MYKIGELSRLCRIPVKTLRYYDNEGVLVPDEIDRFTGYRYYSVARIADCNRIVSLKELGFSLEEIKKHLHASTDEDIFALVDAKCAEIEEKSKELSLQLKKLNHIRKSLSEGERTMFPMAIRSGDTIRVAYQRKMYVTKAEAEAIAIEYVADLPGSNADKIKVREYEKELEVEGRLKKSHYVHVFEIYDGASRVWEVEIDSRTGHIIDIDD